MDIISYLLGKNAGGGGTPAVLEDKTVEITSQSQEIEPSEGYNGMSKVTVNGVSSNVDANILSQNIKRGVEILGIMGTYGSEIIPPDAGTLVGLLIGSLPTKTTYIEGEALDLSGCQILAEYSNGYQYDVTADCTFTCNNPVTYNDTKIVVSYTDVTTETIDIPIVVNGMPVAAPATTKGLWHFDNMTDKNEVNGKGTTYQGLTDPQDLSSSSKTGKFSLGNGATNTATSGWWINANNSLGLTHASNGELSIAEITIEFWGYVGIYTSNIIYTLQMSKANNNSISIQIQIANTGAVTLSAGLSTFFPNVVTDAQTVTRGAWHHFAYVSTGADRSFYVDGVREYYSSSPITDTAIAYQYIRLTPNNNQYLWYDEVLVTESAKYLADFEPPHGPYYIPS